MPTATTYTANLAPAHMRGRYMSLFSLTWGFDNGLRFARTDYTDWKRDPEGFPGWPCK